MQKVLTAKQMREVDRLTTERYGIPSLLLMENAAHAVARVITEKLGGSVNGKSILILCGPGNNGGDGAALARLLGLDGALVDVVMLGKVTETIGDVRTNFGVLCSGDFSDDDGYGSAFCEVHEIQSKDEWNTFQLHNWHSADVVVDAIFGTGLTRPLEIWLYNVIHEINFLGEYQDLKPRLRIAVDIPTGLNADSGEQLDIALQSDVTVTFTAPKAGNILPGSGGFNGDLIIAEIGSGQDLIDEQPSQLFLADKGDASEWLEKSEFTHSSYKNKRGHALIVAGSNDYSGAAVLAGNAAMRSGVGLVTLAVPRSVKESVAARSLPEVIVKPICENESGELAENAFDEMDDVLLGADSIAVGPGLSANDPNIGKLVCKIVETGTGPVIVDAGALWFFERIVAARESGRPLTQAVLTPHEGEFLNLLGTDDKEAIKDRVAAVREFSQKNNVILVLKGERVLIGEPGGKVVVNPTGNSGLGKAGNGDTLTGILVGFIAQAVKMEIDIFETVVAAVYVAGMAGDIAEKKYGKRVMTASDVRECLTEVFAKLSKG